MEIITDQDIIAGCITGDQQFQTILVERYTRHVFKTIHCTFKRRAVAYSQADVEDLHSTVFVSLLEKRCKKLSQYKGKNGCSLSSWIRIITVRIVLGHLRKRSDAMSRQNEVSSAEVLAEVQAEGQNPLALIETAEQQQLLENAITKLADRDQLFLKLHIFKGLSISETADIIGISETNAYTLKHRAISRLKTLITKAYKKGT